MGQSFVFDVDDKDQETGPAFIAGRINEALQALNATADAKLVGDAAHNLWDTSVRYLIEQNGHLGEDSSLFNFREKATANLDWLKPYSVTGDRWADAAIKQPPLFH